MSIGEYLEELRQLGIQVRSEGGQLKISAPPGILDEARRAELSRRKPELIEFLSLAREIRSQQPAIVPLQATGTRMPVFAAAGHNGDVFCYRYLAQHLGPDQPFFGLQPSGYDPGTQPLETVEELARYFADQIIAFRPQQECTIVGYCAGGTIAFELVRQLRERGHPVSRLVLFGAPYCTWYRWPSQVVATVRECPHYWRRIGQRLRNQERGNRSARPRKRRMPPARRADSGDGTPARGRRHGSRRSAIQPPPAGRPHRHHAARALCNADSRCAAWMVSDG
ncbi:MAG: alpha/beta fold hydrolase [Proteobacteria bacterium]|nr:alpha/beta fold hydrolase [Pseudomonadota bacterium]